MLCMGGRSPSHILHGVSFDQSCFIDTKVFLVCEEVHRTIGGRICEARLGKSEEGKRKWPERSGQRLIRENQQMLIQRSAGWEGRKHAKAKYREGTGKSPG